MYVQSPAVELGPAWRACVEEAWDAYRAGSIPVGACLVDAGDHVIARGRNRVRDQHSTGRQIAGTRLAHAELNALLESANSDADPRTLTLYTSVEPCPLCAGAIVMANVRHVRFACRDPWAGSASLVAATPYLRGKAVAFEGPEPALEDAVKAMGVESMLGFATSGTADVLEAGRIVLPRAVAVGEALHRTGELRALANAGSSVDTAFALLWRTCAETIRVH